MKSNRNAACFRHSQKKSVLALVIFTFIFTACTPPAGGNTTPPPVSGDKAITDFWITLPPATGSINESSKTIGINIPFGTNVNPLIAGFTSTGKDVRVGSALQESTVTPNDFSGPVSYIVSAENGTTATYVVTVTILNTAIRGVVNTLWVDGSNIYAAGTHGADAGPGYWLNGAWTLLTAYPFSAFPWEVTSLNVSGGNVTAGGTATDGSYNVHYGYWSNSYWTEIFSPPSNSSFVEGTFWSGTNLYACGHKLISSADVDPGYWLNGTWVPLADPGNGYAVDIVVVGTDVYASGWYETSPGAAPGYWLNGAWTGFTMPADTSGWGRSMAISGSDIYVAGDRLAAGITDSGYWLNGTWHSFSVPSGTYSFVTRVILSGSEVYFVGFNVISGVYQAGYWLNGTWVGLPLPPYAEGSKATCLTVSGGTVYVGGYGMLPGAGGETVPGYWKNGIWNGF